MAITKETPLGEIKGYYRNVLLASLDAMAKNIEKARKAEETINGETDHLDDKKEIVNEFRACLDAPTANATEGTPIGRAIKDAEKDGATKHQRTAQQMELDGLEPDGVDLMDDGVITMMLDIVGYREHSEAIAAEVKTWAKETRRDVYRWAKAMQMAGSPAAVHVKIPPRPAVVKLEWLDAQIAGMIGVGDVEPETLQNIDAMTEEEIGDWIGRGPWMPRVIDGSDPEEWRLLWKGEQIEGEPSPDYTFRHPDETTARKVAASINRMLSTNAEKTGDVESIMSIEEIGYWIEEGPWVPESIPNEDDPSDPDGGQWGLRWMEPVGANEEAPVYTFVHDTEYDAELEAARRNKTIFLETVDDDELAKVIPALFAEYARDRIAIEDTLPGFDWKPLLEDLEIPTDKDETWDPPPRNMAKLAHKGPWEIDQLLNRKTDDEFVVRRGLDEGGDFIMATDEDPTVFPLGEALIWAAMLNAKESFGQQQAMAEAFKGTGLFGDRTGEEENDSSISAPPEDTDKPAGAPKAKAKRTRKRKGDNPNPD